VLSELLSPVVLFFVLGAAAALLRSNLEVPAVVGKALSLYLIVAIGLKGGFGLADAAWGEDAAALLALGVALSLSLPVLAYVLLGWVTGLPRADRAALAAAYGSVSLVTFVAASTYLGRLGVPSSGLLVAVLAVMEVPAILVGVGLARRGASVAAGTKVGWRHTLHEVFTGGAVFLLLGCLAIGWATGARGEAALGPVLVKPLPGALAFFLLEMGLVATRRLREGRRLGLPLLGFAVVLPLAGAALALAGARMLGLGVGDATLLATLAASASYIAVPATFRDAVPEADPGVYLTLPLGVTFPFNLLAGIPLYHWAAKALLGGAP
jgi:uncharacterized protein